MNDPVIIHPAGAPVAVAVGEHFVYPLTPCCQASGKGGGHGVICRACYHDVHGGFGDCWDADGDWGTYEWLLYEYGADRAGVERIVTEARKLAVEAVAAAAR